MANPVAEMDQAIVACLEAVAAMARRDTARAHGLYLGLPEHPHLTPLLKQQVMSALRK